IRSLSLLTYFPLTTSSYNNLTEIEVEHIDQLIFRFSKLQDSMGKKLIPTSYYLLETESEDISFIDILNKLEKLRILPDTEEWLEFRSLRNELSHEYPDQSDTTVEILNRLINLMPEFLALYNHFIASITERNLLSVTK
ncbi:MAG: hypothetical protein KAH21_04450, partial [Spirochaetaceae bacterium]|nr:hypothetical protein [Spirochaetaceae bacterium]